MASNKFINAEEFGKIISGVLLAGKTNKTVAEENGVSTTVVSGCVSAFNIVRFEKYDEVLDRNNNFNRPTLRLIKIAAIHLHKELPDSFEEKYKILMNEIDREKPSRNAFGECGKTEQEEKSADTGQRNETLFFQQILCAVKENNELLVQFMDVVLPKWMTDIKDNLNANTDLTTQRLHDCYKALECIKMNTRKRGI